MARENIINASMNVQILNGSRMATPMKQNIVRAMPASPRIS